ELGNGPERDRAGRAGLGAGRLQPVALPVVAERALVGEPVPGLAATDHAERAGGHAVAAAVADILLNIDVAILVGDERTRRTGLLARGGRAVLADIAVEEPPYLAIRQGLLGEGHVPPRRRREVDGVVVAPA